MDLVSGFFKEITKGPDASTAPGPVSITFDEQPVKVGGGQKIIELISGNELAKGLDWKIRPVSDLEMLSVFSSLRLNGERVFEESSGSDVNNIARAAIVLLKLSKHPQAKQIVAAFHQRLFSAAAPPEPEAPQEGWSGAVFGEGLPSLVEGLFGSLCPPGRDLVSVEDALSEL